ncbi:MAG: hypothetical protein C4518_00180 [Desulfobacteraceae bacterium]|nr:MAG: hypothetical protein C4518_00180 [Desulfobacteraceae bacterium]
MTEANGKNFSAARVSAQFAIRIQADPDAVFALACPKEELKWIDQWQYEMIYSDSGKNENNCIFKEKLSGLFVLNAPEIDTYWHTTLYDKQSRRFHALLIYGNAGTGKFELEIADSDNGASKADWQLTFTALNEQGNLLADADLKTRMTGMLQFLGESAKHYLETGNMLKTG